MKTFRSLSWGFHEPGGAVLWWMVKPSYRLHILSELAFEQRDECDLARDVKLRDRLLNVKPSYTVGTPQIVSTTQPFDGIKGETIGDRLGYYGITIIRADDDELNGWKRCQSLLRLAKDGEPFLTVDPSCEQLIAAIPSGLRDDAHADDIKTPHPMLMAFRYGAMSRPAPDTVREVIVYPVGTPGYIMQQRMKEARGGSRFGMRR